MLTKFFYIKKCLRPERKIMKLYITRHGQTDGNLYKIMDGIRDID